MLSAEILPSILKTKQTDDKRERECFFFFFFFFFCFVVIAFCIFFFFQKAEIYVSFKFSKFKLFSMGAINMT